MNSSPNERASRVLVVEGRVDALSAPDLDARLRSLRQEGPRTIIVDLSGATYISSSGLRALLLALRHQRQAGGELRLRNPSPRIRQILRLAGFDRVFPLDDVQR